MSVRIVRQADHLRWGAGEDPGETDLSARPDDPAIDGMGGYRPDAGPQSIVQLPAPGGGGGGGTGMPSAPGGAPALTPSDTAPVQGLQPQAQSLRSELLKAFPGATIGGYNPNVTHSWDEHQTGQALDFMLPGGGRTQADQDMARRVMDHAFSNGANYVIFNGGQFNPNGTFSSYGSRGGRTQDHQDHVHINIGPKMYQPKQHGTYNGFARNPNFDISGASFLGGHSRTGSSHARHGGVTIQSDAFAIYADTSDPIRPGQPLQPLSPADPGNLTAVAPDPTAPSVPSMSKSNFPSDDMSDLIYQDVAEHHPESLGQTPHSMDPAYQRAKSQIDSIMGGGGGGFGSMQGTGPSSPGSPPGGVTSPGVESYRPMAENTFKGYIGQYGVTPQNYKGLANQMLHQMTTESGGRNIPQQIHDVNTDKGTPAKGVLQFTDPTFNHYNPGGNIWDPAQQIATYPKYVFDRYGINPSTGLYNHVGQGVGY